MKRLWIMTAALALVLGAAGYTIAQSAGGGPQGGQWGMMGPGTGMMGGGVMGQGGLGGMMGSGMMNMMMGQSLTEEQLKQFAEQHGITVEQAKQMTETCSQIMTGTATPEAPKQ
jgi:hypothetical protein